MVEALLIIALGALALLYAQRQSDKKTIEQQSYQIRRMTGVRNAEDELEAKRLRDDYHYNQIVAQLKKEEEELGCSPEFFDEEYLHQRAKAIFKDKYGYEFEKYFNS